MKIRIFTKQRNPDSGSRIRITQESVLEFPRKGYNLRKRGKTNYKNLHHGWAYLQLHRTTTSSKKLAKRRPKSERLSKQKNKERTNDIKLKLRDTFRKVVAICMTQMSAKKGIEKHGQLAVNAILKEYTQLNDLDVFKGVHKTDLTPDQLKKVLRMITVIKEKRCGNLKGRACANGRPQRAYIPKEDTSSPTVALESLILSLIIDGHEGRDVATADVAGAYLHGIMDDFVVVKLFGEEVDIMQKVDPKYKEFMIMENGKKVMYLQLHKALYGTLKAAIILWYQTFSGCLSKLGFKLNPYDPCVANLTVDGSQLTIVWYVDDTLLSHKDPKVIDWLLSKLEDEYGSLTITRGRMHTFVGMDIEFLENGKVKIMTREYLEEAIDDFGEDVRQGATTPASNNLFEAKNEAEPLPDDKRDKFHSIVAKLLFVSKRSRLDIGLAVAFLCTRVSKSTFDDWAKLKRLLKYISATINMPKIIGTDDLSFMKTWVDASYAIHPDMRSHTGGVVSDEVQSPPRFIPLSVQYPGRGLV